MPAADADHGPLRASRRGLLTGLASLVLTACSRAGYWAVNLPATFGSYTRHADLPFGGDPRQRLDVYVPNPPAPTARGARPVVIFWYGGRWQSGDKGDYRFVADALTALGYVVVLPNYRLYPQVKLAGLMQDAAAASHWVAREIARYGGDAQRLYLMGHSAGAHIAALLALDRRYVEALGGAVLGGEALGGEAPGGEPLRIAGVIGLSGPYDFLPLTDADLQDLFGPPAAYPDSQPIHFARADAPPMLLVHGTADRMVWPKNSINLAAALQAVGVQVTLKLYPDVQHADTVAALSRTVRGRAPTLRDIAAFLPPAGG